MNIFIHELKAYRKSTTIWTISLITLVILMLSLYPSFAKDVEGLSKAIEGFPEELRKMMQFSVDSFKSIIRFYSFLFLYVNLLGAIQAMNLGTSMLSKEVREKTADFLLCKPVTRQKIITSKILAALTLIIITNIIFIIVSYIMMEVVKTESYSFKEFFMIAITLFFIQLIFLAIGFLVSVIIPKIKSVISISLTTVFSFFIISMLGSVVGEKVIRFFTPLYYFDRDYIINNGKYEFWFILTELVVIIFSIVVTYIIYTKKDIHTV